jgi:hypothetical protein
VTRNKLSQHSPIFCGSYIAKEGTVFDVIRKYVSQQPDGALYADIVDWMLANWRPSKSDTYGTGYVRAYITGGLKEGYLTQDLPERHEYNFRKRIKALENA